MVDRKPGALDDVRLLPGVPHETVGAPWGGSRWGPTPRARALRLLRAGVTLPSMLGRSGQSVGTNRTLAHRHYHRYIWAGLLPVTWCRVVDARQACRKESPDIVCPEVASRHA